MKKIVLLLLFIISSFISKGQNTCPPAFEIKTDTVEDLDIPDKNWQMLEDASGKLTINQVSSEAFDSKFHINTTAAKGLNYNINTYWARYALKNTLPYPIKITIPEGGVAYAWLYISQPNNTRKAETTGKLVPWSKRDGLKRLRQFVLTIAPGQTITLYERDIFDFRSDKPKDYSLSISFKEPVVQAGYIDNDKSYIEDIVNAIVLGVLLMAGLTNMLFFRIVREKTYLYFSLFLLSYGFYIFLNATDIIFREERYIWAYIPLFFVAMMFYSIMHFTRHFLLTNIHTPKWDVFLIVLSYVQCISWLTDAFIPSSLSYNAHFISLTLAAVITYSYMPLILATMLYYYFKNKTSRTGIIAILPGLLWWGLGYTYIFISKILNELYKIPYSKLYIWIGETNTIVTLIVFSWLIIVFSWALFKRYQGLQQSLIQASLDREIERNQLIAKQNEDLEEKVTLRTAELSAANRELSEQQEEITAQRDQLSETVNELKTTQQQLIQSEKLASLGELTAGIAHEIQNPLNFVNNFSEVSMELVDEMDEELAKGDTDEAKAIAADIKQNLEKIIHHGKRADGIVKGMLQHSRTSTGERQPTNINVLADEFLRLSYHGLRAKDKIFNAELVTNFNESLPKVNIVQQDIGRVLLNLFNNAFYAVNQKQKTAGENYKPEVTVTTSAENNQVVISVKDNGVGISDAVKDKIMQPFFTTKPTGEGTGLGLSLSYDIVVKGHGGRIEVESTEGEGSEFTVFLPLDTVT